MRPRVAPILVASLFLVLLTACGTSRAPGPPDLAPQITYGELDGNDHPAVGLLVFDVDDQPAWRCSGTLLSSTVLLTAGHCTAGTSGGRVWFDSDLAGNSEYPSGGTTSIEFDEIHAHPDYDDQAFYLHDAGVVVLAEPAGVSAEHFGTLPDAGVLDELAARRGLRDRLFTVVGYGLQDIRPTVSAELARYRGTVELVDVEGTFGVPAGTSATFTNNPGRPHRGGTCFGDSGGPIFSEDTTTIVAVTSFGLNPNCGGNGAGYRIDQSDDLAFVGGFLE